MPAIAQLRVLMGNPLDMLEPEQLPAQAQQLSPEFGPGGIDRSVGLGQGLGLEHLDP
ncbi:hypothetical protein D3C71_1987800 [compost metagenome]